MNCPNEKVMEIYPSSFDKFTVEAGRGEASNCRCKSINNDQRSRESSTVIGIKDTEK